ncbi:adenylyltransferase and sulfurtransferase MOCS3 [Sitophilus oryzae]|uniref:Adenylyltransferase and sulfurtransferase MOCS3 homolog n=1 Tax=Sitophilus oryzae TaxID=7048 RepID=A0A6J2YXE3_SITOR|nr:adenylyltransferase and sulfurtransferase MOCS3 [Sitophilus oryzae]
MPEKNAIVLLAEIRDLKQQLKEKEQELSALLATQKDSVLENKYCNNALSAEEITRYSRQVLVPEIGIDGQALLRNAKVLVVGAGGLGCPASVYLASSGVGQLTIVDYDEVELSNLHRQILHSEDDINRPKVESAYDKLHSINRSIKVIPLKLHVDSDSIKKLLGSNKYDVVVDGTDNVATRYLLNDACVLNGIPLVSGSALQLEGQLTVYNYKGGPCYRCLFPVPPPPETVTSCGDGGVLGPVPGIIGVLQALETIKIITNSPGVLSGRLLLFDGSRTKFRDIKLRPRNTECNMCGDDPVIKDLVDYEQFCGAAAHDKVINIDILENKEHVNVEEFSKKLGKRLVLDVRPVIQFQMCGLPKSYNFPYDCIDKQENLEKLRHLIKEENSDLKDVYVICRRGNDSQRAVRKLKENLSDLPVKFFSVKGGLQEFSRKIDPDFPVF